MLSVFGEQIQSLCSKQSKLNFWNWQYLQLHFYAVSWHKEPHDDQTIQFGHEVSMHFGKLWLTQSFWHQVQGGSDFFYFFYYGCRFYQQEKEYSGADWLDLLISNKIWDLNVCIVVLYKTIQSGGSKFVDFVYWLGIIREGPLPTGLAHPDNCLISSC